MRERPLIFVVDDSPAIRRLLEHLLTGRGYDVTCASDGAAGLAMAQELLPDLVLLDVRLPGEDGFEVCNQLKQDLQTADIPVILLTAEEKNDGNVTRGFGAGACDYITKPFVHADVLVRVQQALRQRQQQELFHEMAFIDPLTGLANRRRLITRLDACVAEARRHKQPFSVVICDLDHFKSVNDTYGHDFGDEVLVRFAATLQSGTRQDDLAARYGGEEFAVLVGHANAEQAWMCAEEIRREWAGVCFDVEGQDVCFTASFGVSAWKADDPGLTGDALLKQADQAQYAAKEAGRNCVVRYDQLQPVNQPE